MFKVFYGVAMNYVINKFGNYRSQRYLSVVGYFCPISFLTNDCYVCFFPGCGDVPESTDGWKMPRITVVRW